MASKSELGRMAMTQQRMQQNVSTGVPLASESQNIHQGSQSNDGVNTQHGQEPERSTIGDGSNVNGGTDQQGSSNVNENGGQRRNGALGLVASAASAFDAAKDIMEALRSKHTNLASELEVTTLT